VIGAKPGLQAGTTRADAVIRRDRDRVDDAGQLQDRGEIHRGAGTDREIDPAIGRERRWQIDRQRVGAWRKKLESPLTLVVGHRALLPSEQRL
jgi:hypothetical protein